MHFTLQFIYTKAPTPQHRSRTFPTTSPLQRLPSRLSLPAMVKAQDVVLIIVSPFLPSFPPLLSLVARGWACSDEC